MANEPDTENRRATLDALQAAILHCANCVVQSENASISLSPVPWAQAALFLTDALMRLDG